MVTGRFAPTPSGFLHLGNLFCSLLAWLSAKSAGGRVILRIEDLDFARCDPAYTVQAQRDLALLGLNWDEGGSAGGDRYFQSRRAGFYEEMLHVLEEKARVYPCFCSRAQLHAASAPHASDGEPIYPGTCRALSSGERAALLKTRSPALRAAVPDETISFCDLHYGSCSQNLAADCGDFILRRSDGVFAYQLAVAADDGDMGVTQVVRGRDLLSSTPRQIWLLRLLGLPEPEYAHTPLLLDARGRRLSKREKDESLSGLLEKGETPESIVGKLAFLAGLLDRPEPARPRELIPLFSWKKVPKDDLLWIWE